MGRRKKQPLDEATRSLIIKTAHDLFMEHGYRAVTTRQIAKASGLTQPAMYHYFADKEALYTEVLRTVTEQTKTAMNEIIQSGGSVRERLIKLVAYILLYMPDDLSQMERDIRHELQPETQQLITRWWQESYLLPIASLFEEGQKNGSLQGGLLDPIPSAFFLLSVIQRKPGGSGGPLPKGSSIPVPAEVIAARTVDILLFGMASEEGRQEVHYGNKGDEKA
ncbi:DNA-binding transcriptional regulator, AcrR family [Paenibacillus catalpae]|uniref:DNA-binding transcriptional regulator, AcrR family n=1 Tax=Paenibacillus catalpae TaxID=1045775 RepID=A0A1I2E063_9BACL|nr:TetR/AcrR family transcriptional regulator [Paenibacillus catalpae]SFE86235.1 DNA-binding transcriptional regulator, AcrR family [Paenibacillus catalpae]